jgi:hypothetical protein
MRIASLLRAASLAPCLLAFGGIAAVGCSDKEKVIDIETPGGQVEVERDRKTGEVDVEATDNN